MCVCGLGQVTDCRMLELLFGMTEAKSGRGSRLIKLSRLLTKLRIDTEQKQAECDLKVAGYRWAGKAPELRINGRWWCE
jgi:hypothetical protein